MQQINKFTLLVLLLLSTTSFAANNICPLENVKYKPLRESVEVLLKNVQLEPGCEAQEETLKNASSDLSQVIKSEDESEPTDQDEAAKLTADADQALNKTTTAINSISSINRVLRGRCGRKLMTTFDYMEALTDTVVGLGPLLLLSEGNTALVLYTTVAGQIIKGLINFFRGKKIDMSQADIRNKFIKNSCAFYSLNNKIRALLYTLDTELSVLDYKIKEQQQKLNELNKQAPTKPDAPIFATENKLQQQVKELARLEKMISKIHSKTFVCRIVQRSINKGFGEEVASNLESLLDSSEDGQDIRVFIKMFREGIDVSDQYEGAKCSERAQDWILAIKDLQSLAQEQVAQQVKAVNSSERFQAFTTWQKQVSKINAAIKQLQEQRKSLVAMQANGHNIDLSEILDNRDTIKRALFENSSWRTKSAAHSWLEYKVEQSFSSLTLFQDRVDDISDEIKELKNKQLSKKRQQDLCTSLELVKDSWATALSHLRAAETYCQVFANVIEKNEFKKTYNYCFTYKKFRCHQNSEDDGDIWSDINNTCNEPKRNITSVVAEKLELQKFSKQADHVKQLLQQYKCARPDFMTL